MPSPLQNAMRFSRGCCGSSRSASTHMLTAVKCAGSTSFQARVPGRLQHRQQRDHHRQQPHAGQPDRDRRPRSGSRPRRASRSGSPARGRPTPAWSRASAHATREAEIMRERADADVGAEQHVAEHRGPGRAEARQIGGRAWTMRRGGADMAFLSHGASGPAQSARRATRHAMTSAAASLHNGATERRSSDDRSALPGRRGRDPQRRSKARASPSWSAPRSFRSSRASS